MHRIDTSTAQVDKFGAGKNGFSAGNPQTGTPATDLDEAFFDMLQEELAAVVESSGATLDKTKHNQLLTALRVLLLSRENPFSDIKADGTAAVATALANLGLKEAAVGVAVVGDSRNAKMSIPSASSTATFTADSLIVSESLSGKLYRLLSVNNTINLSTVGAGGMDTGTVPATGYVAIYAIYNPTTGARALLGVNVTSAIAPEVYDGANMPAGYTASALVSVWGTASSQFVIGHQIGRHINIVSYTTFNTTGSQVVYGAMSLALCAPPNARKADMQLIVSQTTPNTSVQAYLASTAEGVGAIYVNASSISSGSSTTSTNCGYKEFDIIGTQTLYFKMANSVAATYTFICGGYTI